MAAGFRLYYSRKSQDVGKRPAWLRSALNALVLYICVTYWEYCRLQSKVELPAQLMFPYLLHHLLLQIKELIGETPRSLGILHRCPPETFGFSGM